MKLLDPAKLTFKNEGEGYFLRQKSKEFFTSKPASQDMLKVVP